MTLSLPHGANYNVTADEDTITIGVLYRKAQRPGDDRIFYLRDAGIRLLRKKESLGHGQWLAWLQDNTSVLGFGERGARSLICGVQWMASNWRLADTLEDIITNPDASTADLAKAHEIRQLISSQFYATPHGTLARRQNDEWYTPPEYISLARTVLGDIDIDPASTRLAQETVRAQRYFNKDENGLRQAWRGRVWLNPPFSQPLLSKFVAKLLMEWSARRMTACIALTHNCTDAMWFQDVMDSAEAVCFAQRRVRFYGPGGPLGSPPHGQTFFYFGADTEAFRREFEPIGSIVKPEPTRWSRRRIRDETPAPAN
jgi:hypothetical protein